MKQQKIWEKNVIKNGKETNRRSIIIITFNSQLFDRIALWRKVPADLFVVVILKVVRAGTVLVMVSELMHQHPSEYLAILVERLIAIDADDTAVVDLDRLAEVIAVIHAEYVKVVVLRSEEHTSELQSRE